MELGRRDDSKRDLKIFNLPDSMFFFKNFSSQVIFKVYVKVFR